MDHLVASARSCSSDEPATTTATGRRTPPALRSTSRTRTYPTPLLQMKRWLHRDVTANASSSAQNPRSPTTMVVLHTHVLPVSVAHVVVAECVVEPASRPA